MSVVLTAIAQVAMAAFITVAVLMLLILMGRSLQAGRVRVPAPARPQTEVRFIPYVRRPQLLNAAEQRFHFRLVQALEGLYAIYPKVRLADVIEVRGDAIDFQAAWSRIAAKHVDFLIAVPESYQPLLVVELESDDASGGDGHPKDDWLDRALLSAGMPIVRVRLRRDYDPQGLRKILDPYLNKVLP